MDSPRAHAARRHASRLTVCWALAAACLLPAGCNNSGRQMQTDLYQRELRLQEDEIYRLEDYIEEYQAIIRGYRCEVQELQAKLADAEPGAGRRPEPVRAEPLPEPAPQPPAEIDLDDAMPEIEMPEIDTPPEAAPPGDVAPAFGASLSPTEPATVVLAAGEDQVEAERSSAEPPAPYPHAPNASPMPVGVRTDASIVVSLGEASDGSLLVTQIAEATAGSLEGFVGQASVMLTDPSVEGRLRRIARWDFTAEEVVAAWETDGLRLPVALPAETPRDQPLRLWVRLIDADGTKRLQAAEVAPLASLVADASPRRLPIAFDAQPIETQPVETSGWRAAAPRLANRRYDTDVAPASFEE